MCRPSSRAAIWSIETASGFHTPGCTSVRKRVAAREWLPPRVPGGGVQFSPDSTSIWSRNGARGSRIGDTSKPGPAAAGVQFCMTMPLGT